MLCEMNRTEAIKKIEYSLATCEPQIITPAGTTYEEHVDRLSKKLLTEVIDPVRVKVTSTIIQGADFEKYRDSEVWAISKGAGGWLLTIAGSDEFALGFGEDIQSIKMHGCSSSDALGEWCA